MTSCLVVDPSKVARTVACRFLQALQIETTEAADGGEALAVCEATMPDSVLLDWTPPATDGMAFLTALRRLPGGDRPRVLMCSSRTDPDHIRQAMEAGADEYIMKPFDSEVIRSKFAQVGLL